MPRLDAIVKRERGMTKGKGSLWFVYVKITFKNNQLTVCTFRGPDVSKRI